MVEEVVVVVCFVPLVDIVHDNNEELWEDVLLQQQHVLGWRDQSPAPLRDKRTVTKYRLSSVSCYVVR